MEIGLISIYAGGIVSLFLAVFHTRFYRSFQWEHEYRHFTACGQQCGESGGKKVREKELTIH